MSEALLEVTDLVKHFPVGRRLFGKRDVVHALDGVSFTLGKERTLAVVGESGCGKSTLARCLVRLVQPTSGSIRLAGRDVTHPSAAEAAQIPKLIQIVFQDPYASLNPRRTIQQTIGDALRLHGAGPRAQRRGEVARLLGAVGIGAEFMDRLPHELSGGQRQRIAICRALAVRPLVVVCDEPVSALDVSVQAQVINLLKRLRAEFGMSYVFITHDLRLVRNMADTIAVMYLGQIVELAEIGAFKARIKHPYSQALFAATPMVTPDRTAARRRIVLAGDVPSPIDPPPGCRFHTRCPYAEAICRESEPQLRPVGERLVRCHFAHEVGFPPQPQALAGEKAA
jgi:oligopeptide/dipeptide ABC transporter ATP-binding protein